MARGDTVGAEPLRRQGAALTYEGRASGPLVGPEQWHATGFGAHHKWTTLSLREAGVKH